MEPQPADLRCRGKALSVVASAAAMLLFATVDETAAPALAQQAMADVAYVEDVSGRVVAFAQGKPILLNAFDTITDRTRLDLQANSELRICHYPTRQFLTLKGPLTASISRDGLRLTIYTRALQAWLGHKNIHHTVRYTELSPDRLGISGEIEAARTRKGKAPARIFSEALYALHD
jgi:hypothetical protein